MKSQENTGLGNRSQAGIGGWQAFTACYEWAVLAGDTLVFDRELCRNGHGGSRVRTLHRHLLYTGSVFQKLFCYTAIQEQLGSDINNTALKVIMIGILMLHVK